MSLDDKITEKIKTEIPNVIDEDDIKELVGKTIEKIVFDERTQEGRYSTKKLPPVIEEVVKDHFEKYIRKEVRQWLNDNSKKVNNHIKEAVQDGFAKTVLESLDRKMENTVRQFIEMEMNY